MTVLEPSWTTAHAVTAVAQDLAGEFSLRPLLERILVRWIGLLACDAGSICQVDEDAGTYRKEADLGIPCQSGQVFPLREGVTGAVVPAAIGVRPQLRRARRPRAPEDRASLRGVIGVPLGGGPRSSGSAGVQPR